MLRTIDIGQKPQQWGPPEAVEAAVRHNCDRYSLPRPLLAMPFWEGAGGKAYDFSGNGLYGALGGTASWLSSGIEFNGLSNEDRMDVDIPEIQARLGISGSIIHNYKNTAPLYFSHMFACGTGNVELAGYFGGKNPEFYINVTRTIIHSSTITDGEYHNLAWLWDVSSNYSAVAVDEQLEESSTVITEPTLDTVLRLGNRTYSTTTRDCAGIVSYFFVFDQVLTADQIAFLHACPYALFEPVSRPSYFFLPFVSANIRQAFEIIPRTRAFEVQSREPSFEIIPRTRALEVQSREPDFEIIPRKKNFEIEES